MSTQTDGPAQNMAPTRTKALSIAITLVNAAVIIGVLLWSGRVTELVSFEGVMLPVSKLDRAARFYYEILQFPALLSQDSGAESPAGVVLPDGRKLLFHLLSPPLTNGEELGKVAKAPMTATTVILKVKSGLKSLHAKIVRRLNGQAQQLSSDDYTSNLPRGGVSALQKLRWGREFAVKDLDGNVLIFLQPGDRTVGRL
jgi:hypothetical protein